MAKTKYKTNSYPYRVYTALLTQSGGDDPQSIGSGAVTEGVTYMVDGTSSDADFSNVGGPKYDGVTSINGTYFVAINNDIPNNYSEGQLNYNTGAPVVTVLENTIDANLSWGYLSTGQYKLSLSSFPSNGPFIVGKTFVFIGSGLNNNVPLYANNNTSMGVPQNNAIIVRKFNTSFVQQDNFENVSIEIRVYN